MGKHMSQTDTGSYEGPAHLLPSPNNSTRPILSTCVHGLSTSTRSSECYRRGAVRTSDDASGNTFNSLGSRVDSQTESRMGTERSIKFQSSKGKSSDGLQV